MHKALCHAVWVVTSRFDAESYFLHRPLYPMQTFSGLVESLSKRGLAPSHRIADLGCGTGQSIRSALDAGIDAHFVGVDPDQSMLARARASFTVTSSVTFVNAPAENTGLPTQSFDAIMIGSAFHWMSQERLGPEIHRILKPQGLLRIFEYQFPKAKGQDALNEWIRRQFNIRWKAPNQKPRGSLKELCERFAETEQFKIRAEEKPPMLLMLNSVELSELLFSQSRVLHFEANLGDSERSRFREETREALKKEMGSGSLEFDFKLTWIELESRRGPMV